MSPRADRPAGPPSTTAGPADAAWMAAALAEARAAEQADEVPIGAVLVRDGVELARAHNETRAAGDPTAHAELLAVSRACASTGEARLPGSTLYTTVEPCFMCAGALLHARVDRVVWAVRDPKFGGCVSLGHVLSDRRSNHRAHLTEGVRAEEARELLQRFFRRKRIDSARDDRAPGAESEAGAGPPERSGRTAPLDDPTVHP